MTTQYIIVGLIIASAAGSVVFKLIRSITRPASKCDGCASACGGCPVHELKKIAK